MVFYKYDGLILSVLENQNSGHKLCKYQQIESPWNSDSLV